MRWILPLLIASALAACSDERSFHERYGETANSIEERAHSIDEDLNSDDGNSAKEAE